MKVGALETAIKTIRSYCLCYLATNQPSTIVSSLEHAKHSLRAGTHTRVLLTLYETAYRNLSTLPTSLGAPTIPLSYLVPDDHDLQSEQFTRASIQSCILMSNLLPGGALR